MLSWEPMFRPHFNALARSCCAVLLTLLAASPAFAQKHKPKKAPHSAPPATKAAPENETPPEVETASPPAPEESSSDQDRDRATPTRVKATPVSSRLLEASLAFDWFTRHLKYAGDTQNTLPPYDAGGAPAASLSAAVFPLRTGEWSVGASGSFAYGFINSKANGGSYTTRANQYSIGARGRYHFGPIGYVGLGFDYGGQNYSIDLPPPTATNAGVPDVAYRYLRPSVEGRIEVIKSLSVLGRFGYLIVLSAGEIISNTYFIDSRSSVSGIDLGLTVAYEVYPHFEIRPGFDYRHYAFSFQPLPTDPRIASTASDTYLAFSLGVGYWM